MLLLAKNNAVEKGPAIYRLLVARIHGNRGWHTGPGKGSGDLGGALTASVAQFFLHRNCGSWETNCIELNKGASSD